MGLSTMVIVWSWRTIGSVSVPNMSRDDPEDY
jgi:hypothetical protein